MADAKAEAEEMKRLQVLAAEWSNGGPDDALQMLHSLEITLSKAMNEAFMTRARDPMAFVANFLLERSSSKERPRAVTVDMERLACEVPPASREASDQRSKETDEEEDVVLLPRRASTDGGSSQRRPSTRLRALLRLPLVAASWSRRGDNASEAPRDAAGDDNLVDEPSAAPEENQERWSLDKWLESLALRKAVSAALTPLLEARDRDVHPDAFSALRDRTLLTEDKLVRRVTRTRPDSREISRGALSLALLSAVHPACPLSLSLAPSLPRSLAPSLPLYRRCQWRRGTA